MVGVGLQASCCSQSGAGDQRRRGSWAAVLAGSDRHAGRRLAILRLDRLFLGPVVSAMVLAVWREWLDNTVVLPITV